MTDEKARARAKDLAFRCLARRPRSRAELASYLTKKEFPEEIIAETVRAMDGYGYLDDRKFAVQMGRHIRETKGLSRYALKSELRRKGVSAEDVDAALEELYGGEDAVDDEAVALKIAGRKAETLKNLPPEKARRRLTDYLRRRGFGFEIISKVTRPPFARR